MQQTPSLSFAEAVKSVFNQYATFSGRARRSEYWFFALFNGLVQLAFYILILSLVGTSAGVFFGVLSLVYALAVLLPSFAVTVRRLHDTGKSGWYWLVAFIPLVGLILMLIWTIKDSDTGENAYGPSPKYIEE